MNRWFLFVLPGLTLLGGCTLMPTYERPPAPVSDRWLGTNPAAGSTNAAAGLPWRDFFDDPQLQALIRLALQNNRDLRIAALRVEQARAQYRIQRSVLFPGVQGEAGLSRQKSSGTVSEFNGGTVRSVYYADVEAAYEIDLFGRIRSLRKEALEKYLASEEAQRSAHLMLVAEVATEYLTQLRLRQARAIARETLKSVQSAYDLIEARFKVGAASELDLRTAEGQVQAVRVNSASFLQLLAESENALAVLIGQPVPNDLPPGRPLAEQKLLADLPAGIPSETLQRRPDIVAAEHTLKAANANIGAARAAFFPRILLTGSAGTASAKLTDLFAGPSGTWSFAPQITIPLFDVGGTRSRLDVSKISQRIEVANYEKAIQNGFREVANALAARGILDEKLKAQELLLKAQQKRFELATARYQQGVDDYVDVLLAQQDLYAAQQNTVQFQAARLLNVVALYRALGGGWTP